MQTLRRCIFDVTHVEIEAAAVAEEAAVAWRLLIVSIMQVDGAGFRFAKEKVLHSHRPGVGMAAPILAPDEAPVFGLNTGDAIHLNQFAS